MFTVTRNNETYEVVETSTGHFVVNVDSTTKLIYASELDLLADGWIFNN